MSIDNLYPEGAGFNSVDDPTRLLQKIRSILGNESTFLPIIGISGQKAMTGSAIQLTSGSISRYVTLIARSTNVAPIVVGFSSGVTNTVDGSGNGLILYAGAEVPLVVDNVNRLYAIGTSGDVVSWIGS